MASRDFGKFQQQFQQQQPTTTAITITSSATGGLSRRWLWSWWWVWAIFAFIGWKLKKEIKILIFWELKNIYNIYIIKNILKDLKKIIYIIII